MLVMVFCNYIAEFSWRSFLIGNAWAKLIFNLNDAFYINALGEFFD